MPLGHREFPDLFEDDNSFHVWDWSIRKRHRIIRKAREQIDRSEGFPRAGYFVPGHDGMGVWPNSEIVRRSGAASLTNTSNNNH